MEQVYLNGDLVPLAEARLSAFDAGLTHGAGLFETMRAYGGDVFRLGAHVARLRRSAAALDIRIPWTDDQLEDAARSVLRVNRLADARLRLTATPGDPGRAAGPEDAPQPTLLVTAQRLDGYPSDAYQRGMTVCVSSFRQSPTDPTAGHKTVSYLPRLLGLREAQRKHCGEALWFTTDHHLAEACMANVFLVRGDTLLTPPEETPVLPGIVRAVILECAVDEDIRFERRALTIDDLLAADEVFLTNSIMEVMPVCRVERHAVGDEKVGELTRRMHELYRGVVAEECRADA